jgi:hypothetical protein
MSSSRAAILHFFDEQFGRALECPGKELDRAICSFAVVESGDDAAIIVPNECPETNAR